MSSINRLCKKLGLFEDDAFLWCCYLFVIALFFSRALLGISSVLLLLFSIIYYLKKSFKLSFKPVHYLFFSLYSAYVFSIFIAPQSVDTWAHLLFKNATYIVLPFAFVFYPTITEQTVRRVFTLFFLLAFACVFLDAVNALLHYNQFLLDVSNSKNIYPIIGPQHQELGILSAIAFVMGIYLFRKEVGSKRRIFKGVLTAILFLGLHIIAYRFSLVAIYLMIIAYSFQEVLRTKNLKLLLGSTLLLAICLYSVLFIPSVKNRYQNSLNDIKSIIEHTNPNFQSVAQRWYAIKCASEIIKKHPLVGVAPANAQVEMEKQYAINSYLLIPENRVFIHNQFVFYILCFGIPLGVLFILFMLFLVIKQVWVNPLLFWLLIPFLFHMLIENTLEKQITANAFIFLFLMMGNKKIHINL